jgi:hypothetical protein
MALDSTSTTWATSSEASELDSDRVPSLSALSSLLDFAFTRSWIVSRVIRCRPSSGLIESVLFIDPVFRSSRLIESVLLIDPVLRKLSPRCKRRSSKSNGLEISMSGSEYSESDLIKGPPIEAGRSTVSMGLEGDSYIDFTRGRPKAGSLASSSSSVSDLCSVSTAFGGGGAGDEGKGALEGVLPPKACGTCGRGRRVLGGGDMGELNTSSLSSRSTLLRGRAGDGKSKLGCRLSPSRESSESSSLRVPKFLERGEGL